MRSAVGRTTILLGGVLLSGCGSLVAEGTADLAGVAGAGLSSAVTTSAPVAAAIGLGVRSLAGEGVRYVARRVHRAEQDAIARVAGPLEPGAVAPWAVQHTVPLEPNRRGEVVVSRDFGGTGFRCREIVFSVDTVRRSVLRRAFYVAAICQDGTTWRWASAEPTTDRWSGLQ